MAERGTIYDALPPYYGGKRKLTAAIFALAPGPEKAPVFFDGFLGGGSVALTAKARGYRVIANDLALRSAVVGKAVIENNRTLLQNADIAWLLWEAEHRESDAFIRAHFCPDVFLSKHADFLDRAFAVVRGMPEGPKRALLTLLLVKYIFYLRPYSKFSSPNAFNIPMEERLIDSIKDRTYKQAIKAALKPIPEALQELMVAVNRGVIDNARQNVVLQMDILDALGQVEADVAYFDPPYAGTLAYEQEYHVLDQILEHRLFKPETSRFTIRDGMTFLDEVFARAAHIPMWIISMGNAKGQNNLVDLVRLVERHRPAKAYSLHYRHIPAVATKDHQANCREWLVVGKAMLQ